MLRKPINIFVRRLSHSHGSRTIGEINYNNSLYKINSVSDEVNKISIKQDEISIKQDEMKIIIKEFSNKNNKVEAEIRLLLLFGTFTSSVLLTTLIVPFFK